MKKEFIFCVAGHPFRMRIEESLLHGMANYAPFLCTADEESSPLPDEAGCIFDLDIQVGTTGYTGEGWQPVLNEHREADMPRIELYRHTSGQWLLRMSVVADSEIVCEIEAEADFRKAQLRILDEAYTRFAIDNATMLLFAFSTAGLKTLEMHASVVVKDQKAYLFLGHSGTGKSTHSRLWMQAYPGVWLLNDDNPVLRVEEAGLFVYGSPWSGKTPCYKNERVQVGGILQLKQAPKNEIHSLRPAEAYAYILSSSSGLKFDHTMMDGIHETVSAVVFGTRVMGLSCLPDTEAAQLACRTLSEDSHDCTE